MSVRLRFLGDAAPKIPGELSAFTFGREVIVRMDVFPTISDYGTLSEAATKHYDGDEDATRFLCALLHSHHKKFLMIILDFAGLPNFTTLGTVGEPREPCPEARLFNVCFTVALRKFLAPPSPEGLLYTRVSRKRRAHMFLAEKCVKMPYRFPPDWGIHTLTGSDHGDRIRSLSDYLWTWVGGLQEVPFGGTQQENMLAKIDAELGYLLHDLAKLLLAIPDADWESWKQRHWHSIWEVFWLTQISG